MRKSQIHNAQSSVQDVPSLQLLGYDDHAVRLHLPEQHLAPLVGLGAVVLGGSGVAAVEQGTRVALQIISHKCKSIHSTVVNEMHCYAYLTRQMSSRSTMQWLVSGSCPAASAASISCAANGIILADRRVSKQLWQMPNFE